MSAHKMAAPVLVVFVLGLMAGVANGEIKDATAVDNYTSGFYTEDQLHEFGTPVQFEVDPDGSYAGLGSRVTAVEAGAYLNPPEGDRIYRDPEAPHQERTAVYLGTEVVLKGGTNTTGSQVTVTMAWRTRTDIEVDARGYPMNGYQMPPMAYDSYGMSGDIVEISGMAGAYVMEAQYDEASLVFSNEAYDEGLFAETGWLYLAWLEDVPDTPGGQLPDVIEWVHATAGNTGAGIVVENYQGSYAEFVAAHSGFTVDGYLGSYGVDTVTNTVWAIIDHNSRFSAVPEPATLGLLALAGLAFIRRSKR